jgi:hypothetical protein
MIVTHSSARGFGLVLLSTASMLATQSVAADSATAPAACTLKFKAATYKTGTNPQSIVVGDFNGDGNLDFAQVNYNGGGAGSVNVFLGKGDGTFQKPAT